jgi:hypothetical protein
MTEYQYYDKTTTVTVTVLVVITMTMTYHNLCELNWCFLVCKLCMGEGCRHYKKYNTSKQKKKMKEYI